MTSSADPLKPRVGLIGLGALLFHAALFILLPWGVEAKAALGLILGVTYMTIGGVALYAIVDDKVWMAKSGAAEIVTGATGQRPKSE
jgi:hypothetical protein